MKAKVADLCIVARGSETFLDVHIRLPEAGLANRYSESAEDASAALRSSDLTTTFKLPFPVLSDIEHKIIEAYDLYNPDGKIAKPALFVLDKKGVVRWVFLDEDYRIRAVNDAVLAELKKLK